MFCSFFFFAVWFYACLTYKLLSECYKTNTNYIERLPQRFNSLYFFNLLLSFLSKKQFKYNLQHKSKNAENFELYMLVLSN